MGPRGFQKRGSKPPPPPPRREGNRGHPGWSGKSTVESMQWRETLLPFPR